jgi:hypothetical protein
MIPMFRILFNRLLPLGAAMVPQQPRFTAEHAENAEKDPVKFLIIRTFFALRFNKIIPSLRPLRSLR